MQSVEDHKHLSPSCTAHLQRHMGKFHLCPYSQNNKVPIGGKGGGGVGEIYRGNLKKKVEQECKHNRREIVLTMSAYFTCTHSEIAPLFQSTTSTQDMEVHQRTEGIKFYSNSSDAIMEY